MKISLLLLLILPLCLLAKNFEEPWGKDSSLILKPTKKCLNQKKTLSAKLADSVISFYQGVISPTNGPRSNFRPTSSRYMQLAINRYGFIKGYLMGCDRLMRENDENWVYQYIHIDHIKYKYDPALEDKFYR